MRLKKLFFLSYMDKESDPAFIKQGATGHAENLRFLNNEGNDGKGKNIKGSTLISDLTNGNADYKCICAYYDENLNVIYYFITVSDGSLSKIIEYNLNTLTSSTVLNDSRGVLNFNKDGYITGINEINGLLYWSEWGNNPRVINVERAKTYAVDGFDEEDIKVIKRPPIQKLKITPQDSGNQENYIEDLMINFSYRFRHLDGEYSVLAPFTNVAFEPNDFDFDFSEQSNRSMINKYNQVLVEFFTGSERVTEIQLIWKESGKNEAWIIDDFNKEKLGYNDNEVQQFIFENNKTKRALPKEILNSYFDGVPLTSKGQALLGGRLFYSNYIENQSILIEEGGDEIEIDYSLELVTSIINNLSPKKTVKSNREYEVGMVYVDDDGRISTVLNSKTNTLKIPNENNVTQNKIRVILKHQAPYWAKYYRFFIKQYKHDYDQILPTLFYEDGAYRWVKIEGADKDKIKEGDFLIVKSDTQGVVNGLKKVKVLEVKEQEQNFLEPENKIDEIVQRSGLYFKIKPQGVRFSEADFNIFNLDTYDTSANKHDTPVTGLTEYISPAHFYGDTLNDLSTSGAYTGATGERLRFLIQIDSIGAQDSFRWSIDDGANYVASNVPITGGAIALQDGVSVTFTNQTGHSLNDEWNINATAPFSTLPNSKAYGFFRAYGQNGEVLGDSSNEAISSGARIRLIYNEYLAGDTSWEIDVLSGGNYDTIQEWFYKDDIISLIGANSPLSQIRFVKGLLQSDSDNANRLEQDLVNGIMTMVVQSNASQNGDLGSQVRVSTSTEIIQLDQENLIVLETEPVRQLEDVFYEVGKTYLVIQGNHTIFTSAFETQIPNDPLDQGQSIVADVDLEINLDWFNAFAYGNGIESYKIRDEFNEKRIDVGPRALTFTKERYEQVHREEGITWSDVYNDETNFNGLSTFNYRMLNFLSLNQEEGSIQKIHSLNGDLLVLQENQAGILPYNKQIINEIRGGQIVGISKNVLNKSSYRIYGNSKHGISKNPESFVQVGSRNYFTDQRRGKLIRLANDGETVISDNFMETYFSGLMLDNGESKMIAAFDYSTGEYLLHLPQESQTLGFKEKAKGFPNFYTYEPDFVLNANNQLFAWKNGQMYRMNDSETRNNFFGQQYESKIKFFFNQEFSLEKVWKALSLESTHPWLVNLTTELTSRQIPKNCFVKKEDYWFSEIMGNTNSDDGASEIQGLGNFAIVDGVITTEIRPISLSVGDVIISATEVFAAQTITDITSTTIVLENIIQVPQSFLMYRKNQNIDGTDIRGNILEVEMISDETEEVILTAVNAETSKSFYT